MKELLMNYGGYAAWLFIVALGWQALQNIRKGVYRNGTRGIWWMFTFAHATFAVHLGLHLGFMSAAVTAQLGGLLCDIVLLAQSYAMRWEKHE